MRAILIPLKDPSRAKTRLAGALSADQRRALVWAMFEDVAEAVGSAMLPDRVAIVTTYEPAIKAARLKGWDAFIERAQSSESESVDWASHLLKQQGCDLVMRLPADIPLVQACDIDELLSVEIAPPGSLLVPSRDGSGTNAIMRTPPDLFRSFFGQDSRALHKKEAARIGATLVEACNERIGLDIDDLNDLRTFVTAGSGTKSYEFLLQSGILEAMLQESRSAGGTPKGL